MICICGTRCGSSEKDVVCSTHGRLVRGKRIEAGPDMAKAEIEVWEPAPVPPTSVPVDQNVQSGMFRSYDC